MMRTIGGVGLGVWLMTAGIGGASLRAEDVPRYSIDDFLDTTRYSGASFSPDKSKVLVTSNASGIPNAYAIPVEGGAPEPLTESETDPISAVSYFPEDERFLYTSDQGGNELNHLYVKNLDGSAIDLTPGENLKASFAGWAQDDRSFFVETNERDPRYFDLYEITLPDFERTLVFQNDDGDLPGPVSPDKRFVALNRIQNRDDSDVYLYDRETGEVTHLTPHEGEINHSAVDFRPDGEALLMAIDEGSEFSYLVEQDLETGERRVLVKEDWDVMGGGFSKRGTYLSVALNVDARTERRLYRYPELERVPLPEVPEAAITSLTLSRDETRLAFYASSSRMPSDLFVAEVGSTDARRLTRSLSPRIEPEHLVEGEVVRFESFDDLEIPGILYMPKEASKENRVPALVWVHGGPGGQSRIGYIPLIQYLVNHGYAIFAINNRGSSGYGRTFEQLDNRQHGEGDLDDCVASKTMLAATGTIDPERIGILGGSYGGYMVLAALAFRPEAFDVGVDIFGVANWYRTVQNIPPWWEAQRAALEKEMGDFDDEDYFRSISPLFHADRIRRPLIVLQGANDPRVLKVESDEIVDAVKANGVPVEYVVFPDEGHGFRKKANEKTGYRAIREFLDEHLAGDKQSD